ncbi:Putative inositol polyphosphate phosphatase (Synaptogenin-like) family protein [Zea mays]|uniref:Putative inositol polyphosphate phosphatase (Synaptogenin-like) family protein n=1 Tax=Zea mays TaxID=4577 RepID=A0A1D6MB41_MAIZE|nr:Putative inositol polyphosphate phosphatase (Synaptogenin-like) family protein [Zea mays]
MFRYGKSQMQQAAHVPCRLRRQKSEILRAQYVDVRELRVCAGTWNVGGICPPNDLDIEEWLDIDDEPADIYVLGFQEIIPLEVGYMIGTEDTRPVAVWEHIIHETLNKKCPDKSKSKRHSDSPPPARFNPLDYVLAVENELHNESNSDSDGELHRLHNAESSDSARRRLRPLDLACGVHNYNGDKRKRLQYVRGSVSVSMTMHETHFCFVCCHLASGEKNGDELKRNANVEEINRRTVFNPVHTIGVPQRIHDHERITLLGDLNYRLNLSYETTHELISKQDWDGLFKMDQLKKELGKGCTFDGWVEGPITFPPTYKYEFNSEKYVSDATKSGRRTPAWCDRILSYGEGTRLLSYNRAELILSDHRPVTAVYMADVEIVCPRRLQRALTFSNAEAEDHLLSRKEAHLEPKTN